MTFFRENRRTFQRLLGFLIVAIFCRVNFVDFLFIKMRAKIKTVEKVRDGKCKKMLETTNSKRAGKSSSISSFQSRKNKFSIKIPKSFEKIFKFLTE